MRFTLKTFQEDAVRDSLRNLVQARDMYRRYGAKSQFALAAVTGSGKTVMSAAVIEALLTGSEEFGIAPDPGAVVLWFSDNPALNVQSRNRIQQAASELDGRLRLIEPDFNAARLTKGMVYFLNAQKLSKNSRLVRGDVAPIPGLDPLLPARPDTAQSSIYDTITATIEDETTTLYLVLDEAHRGMSTTAAERETIVQRLISGAGQRPPLPIVMGISATVERFTATMNAAKDRVALPSVEVDSALVQESGLLKDDLILTIPDEAGAFDTVLLSRGVEKILASERAWKAYGDSPEGAEAAKVAPLLVVQVPDKPTDADLVRMLDTIRKDWPDLPPHAVAHVFGEHTDLNVGRHTVAYIEPQRVQGDPSVRVLLAKTAITTGWDCPRAEVLVSFRSAEDRTHITQLLGRMVRTPLAIRVPGDEVLNSVACILPGFNRVTAKAVADSLVRGGRSDSDDDRDGTGGGAGRRILFDPVELHPNPAVPEAVWEVLETLPSVTLPRPESNPIRRALGLAALLSRHEIRQEAIAAVHTRLHRTLDGRAVEHADELAAARHDVETMVGVEGRGRLGEELVYETFQVEADALAIEDAYGAATRALTPALCRSYSDHLAGPSADEDDLLDAHAAVAAIGRTSEIVEAIRVEAQTLARKMLEETRVERKNLSEIRQAEYDRFEGMSTETESLALVRPRNGLTDRSVREADGSERLLPTYALHLLADGDGLVPADLNTWESSVLEREMGRPGALAWYRNPARATKESLAVAYRDGAGTWRSLRPDFIFFARGAGDQVVADIVDPHGHHLADAVLKLRGLADFAVEHGSAFRRIEAVALVGTTLRALDLTREHVREAVASADDALALYRSDAAVDY